MKAFISEILGYDPKQEDLDGGILGVVKAYYGCVEAQGRGTLHYHMLIWLEGGLNPNQIKEKALANGGDLEFQKRLLAFLDDTISNSVPPDPDPEFDLELGKVHPCSTRGPTSSDKAHHGSREKDLHNLVKKCQVHTHHPTCYKYWRGPPEPKDCRFDLDEANVTPVSMFDPDTGEIVLRCLDGLVNNFNETILEAMRCNMDIKFIGSGPAAKAILYYITDYITKTQLQAHVAYAALELAVKRLGEYDPNVDEYTVRARKLLQKCAHAMIAKQELSAQQVVSYLMDYEDHFTSHKFNSLYWTSFEKFINDEDPSPECYRSKVESLPEASTVESELETEPVEPEGDDAPDIFTAVHSVNESIEESEHVDDITLIFDNVGRILPSANQFLIIRTVDQV
ncbi:hypothetical protein B0H19DRAFT_969685 [Mycena capillaripes]|nr:hypothetical protein B0H19DRAFT_969685 [Mycena capillaripes]